MSRLESAHREALSQSLASSHRSKFLHKHAKEQQQQSFIFVCTLASLSSSTRLEKERKKCAMQCKLTWIVRRSLRVGILLDLLLWRLVEVISHDARLVSSVRDDGIEILIFLTIFVSSHGFTTLLFRKSIRIVFSVRFVASVIIRDLI